MLTETYWAVIIGEPKIHAQYFMRQDGGSKLPKLFCCEDDAKEAGLECQGNGKTVRIEIRELK